MTPRTVLAGFAVVGLLAACGSEAPTVAGENGGPGPGGLTGADAGASTDSGSPPIEPTPDAGPPPECATAADCATPSNACAVAVCSAGTCGVTSAPETTSCDDGDACTLVDSCTAGQCAPGTPVVCVAQDECHDAGVCAPGTGACSNPAKPDGTTCTGTGKCLAGVCTPTAVVLARQDFEVAPAAPAWAFTGPVIYNMGTSSATAAPPNSPIGIGASRAWETTVNGAGLTLDFANVVVPAGYDRVRLRFRLAAMNLVSGSGGPDDLDYVLVAYSLDDGTTYTNRVRVRGAINNNSFWGYDATGLASVDHLPATEALFQPTTTGLQTTLGYSTVEIVFPGTITQVRARITARSSSSSDTWLVDDLTLTGERDIP